MTKSNTSLLVTIGLATPFALTACPVDDRALQPEGAAAVPVAQAGTSTQAGASTGSGVGGSLGGGAGEASGGTAEGGVGTGGAAQSGAGGDAGASLVIGGAGAGTAGAAGSGAVEPEPGVVDGCADLDFNAVGDCSETLLTNADFKQDISGWSPDQTITQSWRDDNAVSPPPSGSGYVSSTEVVDADGFALAGTAQCVPVTSSQSVEVYASIFIESGQDQGFAGINLWFYDAEACQGPISANYTTPFGSGVDSWLTIQGVGRASPTAKSMLVRLAIGKPFRATSFHALFDNVLVKAR